MLYKIEALLGGSWEELAGITGATLSEAKNSISKLELKLDPTSEQAAGIKKGSRIRVQNLRNQRWAFYGRVLSRREATGKGSDYIGLTCEGCVGFLCDTAVWIDSRKGYFDGTNASYPVEIDEDDGSRTMDTGLLSKLMLSQHNLTVGDNGGDEWKKLESGISVPSGYETTFTAEYTASTYKFLAACAADCGAEFRGEYDGSKPTYRMSRSIGKRGAPLKLADNVAKMVADDSMAGVVTRMVPYGDEYAKLKKTSCKGVTVTGALKGDKWDGSAKTDTGSAAKMVRFDVEGATKCVLKVGRRCKSYPMVFFTDKKLTSGGKVLKKYVPSSNSTADVTKRYPVPDEAKYCYVFGSGSSCTTYGYYTNSAGVQIRKNYRTDLGFWAAKLTSSELQALVDAYCPGATIGYTVDGSNDRNYYLAKNESEYGVIEGTCLVEGQLNTGKITDPKKAVYSVNDLKATKRRAKSFLKAALQELEASCRESIEVSVNGYDLYMAGVDGYEEMELYDICRATNERYGIDVDVEIVSIKRDLLKPASVTLGLGTVAVRASTYGNGSSGILGGGTASSAGDDDDSAADEYETLSAQYAAAAEVAASKAVEKAAELDPLSYQIQVDALAAGQMASDAYDTVHPIADSMRGLLNDAEDTAHNMTAVVTRQEQTIEIANALARATASYACETVDSVVKWRKAFTASLDAFASEDPEVQADIAKAYALLYGANGTFEHPEADSAQGHLNAAKETNVQAAQTYMAMKTEWEAAKSYKSSCESVEAKAQAAYDNAKAAYDKAKVNKKASKKTVDSTWTALKGAQNNLDRAQEAVEEADAECSAAEGRYIDALAALEDAESKVTAAQAEVDTAINGISVKYASFFEVTANRIAGAVSKTDMDGAISQAGLDITAEVAKMYATKTDVNGKIDSKAAQEIAAEAIKMFVQSAGGTTSYTVGDGTVLWEITKDMTAVQDSTARNSANSAANAASNAQSTANTANSNASTALSAANSAQSDVKAVKAYMSFSNNSGTGTLTLGGSATSVSLGGSQASVIFCNGAGNINSVDGDLLLESTNGGAIRLSGSGNYVEVTSYSGSFSDVACASIASYGAVTATGNVTCAKLITKSAETASGENAVISPSGYLRKDSGSSRRYKRDIADVADDALNPEHLYDIPVRQFVFKDGYLVEGDEYEGRTVIGLIAEEVEEHYPVAVFHNEFGQTENWNIRYIAPAMLKLIQDQKKLIDALTARLDALEGK